MRMRCPSSLFTETWTELETNYFVRGHDMISKQLNGLFKKILVSAVLFASGSDDTADAKNLPSDQVALWQSVRHFRLPAPPSIDDRSEKLAQFGRQLFHDARLSKNGQVSCASCHQPDRLFTDGRILPQGLALGQRHTPSIVNTFAKNWFFWDGRADSLAAQALQPLENPSEHGLHRYAIIHAIWQNHRQTYRQLFGSISEPLRLLLEAHTGLARISHASPVSEAELEKQKGKGPAFGSKALAAQRLLNIARNDPRFQQLELEFVDWQKQYENLTPPIQKEIDLMFARVGQSIAAFEKTIVSQAAPFDRFLDRWQGQGRAEEHLNTEFDEKAWQGLQLFFGKAQCFLCHHGPYFTDHQFHHVGFPQTIADQGRWQGLKRLRQDQFACESPLMADDPSIRSGEACEEKTYLVDEAKDLIGAFKTPSLRHVAQTAPYGHAGQFANLEEVLQHYNEPRNRSQVGKVEESLQHLHLNAKEISALEAFLRSLSSEWQSTL
ncbi:MAG: cytochrome-c peroxidase [Oligoflexus sp.]